MGKRHDLPSTYYRVSLKALIFDVANILLLFQDKTGEWELPGGGFEHQESVEDCLRREITEEVGGRIAAVSSGPKFLYVDHEPPGYYKLSIAYKVALEPSEISPAGDDLVAYRYVTREEFEQLPFQQSERAVLRYTDSIWAV